MIFFCEYVVRKENRESFLRWAEERPYLWKYAEFMENEEQPGVFVELWRVSGEADLANIKKERLEGRSEWREMEGWLKGGAEGLRSWTFRTVSRQD